MTNEEERAYLLQQVQWEFMRFNESRSELNRTTYNLQTITQALIDHLNGVTRDE